MQRFLISAGAMSTAMGPDLPAQQVSWLKDRRGALKITVNHGQSLNKLEDVPFLEVA